MARALARLQSDGSWVEAGIERHQGRPVACRFIGVLVHSQKPTADATDLWVAASYERAVETAVLLEAVAALHADGILTDAEYKTKRQQLAAQL